MLDFLNYDDAGSSLGLFGVGVRLGEEVSGRACFFIVDCFEFLYEDDNGYWDYDDFDVYCDDFWDYWFSFFISIVDTTDFTKGKLAFNEGTLYLFILLLTAKLVLSE